MGVMELVDVEAGIGWLIRQNNHDGRLTAFDVSADWPVLVWVLHAMDEPAQFPAGLTHDDVPRIEVAAGAKEPTIIGDVNLGEEPAIRAIGAPLGRSRCPGAGWACPRWAQLAERLGVDPFAHAWVSHRSFPYDSWPASLRPPVQRG